MDEVLLVLETGQGGRYAKPAIELQLKEEVDEWYFRHASRFVGGDWDSHNSTAGRSIGALKLQAQHFYSEDGDDTDGSRGSTYQFGARYTLRSTPWTLTLDHSRDAFEAGPRSQVGLQYYKIVGKINVWAWVVTRHFHDFDTWNEEYYLQVGYQMAPNVNVSIRKFDSDFYGDNTTLRVSYRFD